MFIAKEVSTGWILAYSKSFWKLNDYYKKTCMHGRANPDRISAPTSTEAAAMLVKLSTGDVPKLYCPVCNKALVSLAGYVKHVKKHEPPGGFTCRYCEARFCSDAERKKHRESEHTTIACRLCKDVTFTNEVNYKEHIRNVHKGVDREIFTCDKCGATYKTIDPYRQHMETECGRIKPYKCENCPMAFVKKYYLKQHLNNHFCEFKCCCSYCERKSEGPAPQHPKKKVINFAVEDDVFKTEEFIDEKEEANFFLTPEQNQNSTEWSSDSEDEYVADFEPVDSESDKEESRSLRHFKMSMPVASIKQNNCDENDNSVRITTNIQMEPLDTYSAQVKYEAEEDHSFVEKDRILETIDTYLKFEAEEYNLCNGKDRLLEPLLNENYNSELAEARSDKSNKKSKQGEPEILKESEIVYIKQEESDGRDVDTEDILEEVHKATEVTKDDIRDSYVLLEDVTNCLGSLKETSIVNVPRNIQRMRTKGINTERECDEGSKSRKYRLASISRKQLIKHTRRDKSRQCPECRKIYYRRKPFEMHLRNDHKKSEDFIKQIFRNDLEEVSADVFKCHICDKVYLVEKWLLSHIPKHGPGGTKVHKCSCCTLYFTTREEATAHAHKKHKDLLWCVLCEKFMISYDALNSHKARQHGGNKNYKRSCNLVCNKFGKEFMVQTKLTDHKGSDCGRIPLYQCQECSKSFKTAGKLKSHMIVHNDARPYQCDKCGRNFKVKGHYENHIKYYHLDKRRFKCQLCPKEYPYRESLYTHMSEHTVIKHQAQEVTTNNFDNVAGDDVKAKEFIDEDEEGNFSIKAEQKTKEKNIAENSILTPPEVLMSDKSLQNQKNPQRSDDFENEYVPDIEQADSHSYEKEGRSLKDIKMTMSVDSIKQKNYDVDDNNVRITTNTQIEPLGDFEYTRMNTYSAVANYEAKEDNLVDADDRILKHILNKNDYRELAEVGLDKSNNESNIKKKRGEPEKKYREAFDDILKEAEEKEDDRKDKLEEVHKATDVTKDHIRDCYVLLEDITNCFPLLKDTCTVKVPSNVQPFYSKSKKFAKHGPDGTLVHECPCNCSLYFTTREEATAHAHQKHKDLLWCELCEKFMLSCEALNSHKAQAHGGNMNYKCSRSFECLKCGKKFMGRTQLTDHERSDCGRLPLYKCQECGKCLKTAHILMTHMLLHNDARPYQCDKCGKTFKITATYRYHIKYAHNEEKRFKCHLCPKQYPYRASLISHMSVHTGIKRYKCDACGKRFSCVSNLTGHHRVHPNTCGLFPLNTKATQYMGVQKGNFLIGAKPESDSDYVETKKFCS